MEQLNRIELRGNVGNVIIRKVGGSTVARFSLATTCSFKDREGCPVIEITWHQVVAWEDGRISGLDRIGRGSAAHVEGRLRALRHTAPDGSERIDHEVVAGSLEILPDGTGLTPQAGLY